MDGMAKPKLKVLSLRSRPKQLAKDMRQIARTIREENSVRYFMVVALRLDGDTDVWAKGSASQAEQLGVLLLAQNLVLQGP